VDKNKSHTYNHLYDDDPEAIANRVYTVLYYDTSSGNLITGYWLKPSFKI
jgi:hypothetical protein